MVVIENGAFVDAQVGWGKVAVETFYNTPLKIEPCGIGRLDDIKFLAGTSTDICDKDALGSRVVGHAMRTAQSEGVEFFQDPVLTNEGVADGDVIMSGDGVLARGGN